MQGKTVLITGATDGIGRATALNLAKAGATVLIHGRRPERGERTLVELKRESGNDDLHLVLADLSSLGQVRSMAESVRRRTDKLDVLINNAGIFMHERMVKEGGLEMTFLVNHLAPFLLTHLLLEPIQAAKAGRIITVSSIVHTHGHLDFNDLQGAKAFDGFQAYATSKLANILFSMELAERLRGTSVTANCLHPGVIGTKLHEEGFGEGGASVEKGAETSTFLALSPAVAGVTGAYFVDCQAVEPAPDAKDPAVRKLLWNVSEKLVGIS